MTDFNGILWHKTLLNMCEKNQNYNICSLFIIWFLLYQTVLDWYFYVCYMDIIYYYFIFIFSVSYNVRHGKPRKNRCGDYTCPQCGRTYVHKYTMQTHIKYECNQEPQFVCQFCGKGIYYPSNYKKHLLLKHDHMID